MSKRIIALFVFGVCATAPLLAQWTQPSPPTGPIYYNGGNVGINTTSPAQALTVFGSISMNGNSPRFWAIYNQGVGNGSDFTGVMGTTETISFGFNSQAAFAGTVNTASGRMMYFYDRVSGAYRASLDGEGSWWFGPSKTNFGLRVMTPTSGIIGMTINTTGSVGIGIATPAAKLDVNGTGHFAGDVVVDGNLAAKYQDVAEWVPATGPVSNGTVVIISPGETNRVTASTDAYDTRVAGVISAQPGIILGEGGPSKVMVATSGRVKVRVDATHQPIVPGDLLVSSGTAGVAMKSQPIEVGGVSMHRPGTLIGKALEPLPAGTGEILVLLSLQ
jgi:hypothetical protein